MESPEGKISNSATKALFIPKLPPSLSDWKTLKTHFSQYGDVSNVVVNPQQRWCTVSFKTVADAEASKANGCSWKGKAFNSQYWSSSKSTVSLDPRSVAEDIFSYSDLDALWSDEDVENFGVIKSNPSPASVKPKEKTRSPLMMEQKKKPVALVKSPKQKVKLIVEKVAKLKESENESGKEKQKDVKKRVRGVILEVGKQKRLTAFKKKKDETSSKAGVNQLNLSLKEKFAILEERDKLIRKSFVKSSNVTSKAIVGTCPDMCPEKERIMREFRRLVSIYEMIPGTQVMDPALAVKAYVRSSADQEEPLPHELRPEPVLSMTMSYLINEIMPLVNNADVDMSDWYDFCWDRLRGIRKDIIQQQLCDLETVTIIEQCARFHICCYDLFWGADPLVFDEKINTENLLNCLQTLRHMYDDLSKENIECPNEAEFTSYMILLSMNTGDLMGTYQQFPEKLQKKERIQLAVKIYLTFNNSMYSQFFKLVKKLAYLDSCLLQRYFYDVRVAALQAIARAYCPPNKGGSVPLKHMMKILKFDTPEDTKLFCEGHGLSLKDNKKDFRLYRNDFFFPEAKISVENSSSLVSQNRLPLVEAVVGISKCNLRDYKTHRVHSSFTKDGKLTTSASDATDQKIKSSEMYVEASDTIEIERHNVKMEFDNVETNDDLYTEEKEHRFNDMDVDGEVSSKYSSPKSPIRSVQERNNFSFSNNDTVSRKQNASSSAFRFDLKHPVQFSKDAESLDDKTAEPFKFSLATSIFHDKNVSPSSFNYQVKPNQSDLKIDVVADLGSRGSHLPSTNKISSELLADYEDSQSAESYSQTLDKKISSKMKILKRDGSSDKRKAKKLFDKKSPKLKHSVKRISISDRDYDMLSSEKKSVLGYQIHDALKYKDKNETDDSFKLTPFSDSSLSSAERSSTGEFNKGRESVAITIHDNVDCDILKSDFNFADALMFGQSSLVKENENCQEKMAAADEKFRQKEEDEENKRKLRLKEEQVMKKLKKDLRRKMKATTARHFIRKWKEKVKKIKQNRKEFPLLISVPADKHISIWGTAVQINSLSSRSLLNRLKEKRQSVKVVKVILENCIQNTFPYLGDEIANSIANNYNDVKLNLRDFNLPLCYKLIVSIPFLKEKEFFTNKFKQFIKKLFYKPENSVLGSVVKVISSQNVPVYYCVHVVFGNDFHEDEDKLIGMNGVIFVLIDGVENSSDKCKRLKNLLMSDLTIKPKQAALMKIGKECDDRFCKVFDDDFIKNKINRRVEECWNDCNSFSRVLKFLTENIDASSTVRVYTLYSLLKQMIEHIYDALTAAQTMSDEFCASLSDPNIIINVYNSLFDMLEDLVLDSDFNDYDVLAPEFKQYIEYLNEPGESCRCDIGFNKSRRSNIIKAFSKIKLPNLKHWPPNDQHDLLNIFRSYCDTVNCNILSRIIRIIDFKDDDDNVDFVKYINNEVLWINIVDLIVNCMLRLHCDETKSCVVICDANDVSDLSRVDFCFKLLQSVINN